MEEVGNFAVFADISLHRFIAPTFYFSYFSVVCFDAKINFDDNAKFRQQDLFSSEDVSEKNPREVEAEKYNLNYIGMDGNIACIGKKHSKLLYQFKNTFMF